MPSIEDHEVEFQQFCDQADDDLRALRNDGAGANPQSVMRQIEFDLKEAAVELKNMEVEAASDPSLRATWSAKLKGHHSTLARLRGELSRAQDTSRSSEASDRSRLFSQPGGSYQNDGEYDPEGGQMMDRLLMSTERQKQTSERLASINRMSQESEEVGRGVLENLHLQRATIISSKDKLKDSDEHLSRASKILKSLERSMVFDNILKAAAGCLLVILLGFIFYIMISR